MTAHRHVAALFTVAFLFAQMVTGVHMAGHLPGSPAHAHPASTAVAHASGLSALAHAAWHDAAFEALSQAQVEEGTDVLDLSCALYHVHAGHQCTTLDEHVLWQASVSADSPLSRSRSVGEQRIVLRPAIRGPPVFS